MFYRVKFIEFGVEKSEILNARNVGEIQKKFKNNILLDIKNISLFTSNKIPIEQIIVTFSQFESFFNIGLEINQIFEEVIKTLKNERLIEIFTKIQQNINLGNSIYESFYIYDKEFYNLTSILQLASNSGNLDIAFSQMANILKEKENVRKKLKKALFYPAIILAVSLIAILVMSVSVVPKVVAVVEKLNTELPQVTKILISISYFLQHYLLISIIVIFLIIWFIKVNFKNKIEFYKSKLTVIKYSNIYLFTTVFSHLLQSGISFEDAFKTSLNSISNIYIKSKLKKCLQNIVDGKDLCSSFENSKIFDTVSLGLINSGAIAGKLENSLSNISTHSKNIYESKSEKMISLIEPILITILSGVVLFIAVAILLPIWKMSSINAF